MATADDMFHYEGYAECLPDVINGFKILLDKYTKVINAEIKSSMMLGADFSFWSNATIEDIEYMWRKEGTDLHRMCQSLNYSKKDCAGNKKALAARKEKNNKFLENIKKGYTPTQ